MSTNEWEPRIARLMRGEYPQQVYPRIELLTLDIKAMSEELAAQRAGAERLRVHIRNRLDTAMLEVANASADLTRRLENARKAMP